MRVLQLLAVSTPPVGQCATRRSWLAADFNRDGKVDLAVATPAPTTCAIFMGNGNGTFRAPIVAAAIGTAPRSMAMADFDGDGKFDLAVERR